MTPRFRDALLVGGLALGLAALLPVALLVRVLRGEAVPAMEQAPQPMHAAVNVHIHGARAVEVEADEEEEPRWN